MSYCYANQIQNGYCSSSSSSSNNGYSYHSSHTNGYSNYHNGFYDYYRANSNQGSAGQLVICCIIFCCVCCISTFFAVKKFKSDQEEGEGVFVRHQNDEEPWTADNIVYPQGNAYGGGGGNMQH